MAMPHTSAPWLKRRRIIAFRMEHTLEPIVTVRISPSFRETPISLRSVRQAY